MKSLIILQPEKLPKKIQIQFAEWNKYTKVLPFIYP